MASDRAARVAAERLWDRIRRPDYPVRPGSTQVDAIVRTIERQVKRAVEEERAHILGIVLNFGITEFDMNVPCVRIAEAIMTPTQKIS